MIKLKKQPNDILLATDFKKIGRTTSIERSAIRFLGLTTSQLYDSGLMSKLEAMADDKKISPMEKTSLSNMLTQWTSDYNMLANDADRRNVDRTDLDEAFNVLSGYLQPFLANMSDISTIPDSDFRWDGEKLVWILYDYIQNYDDEAQTIQETISNDSVIKEYYGSVKIDIILGKEALEVGEQTSASANITFRGNPLPQYVKTIHKIFKENSDYYIKQNDVYIKVTVTPGTPIPEDVDYYHQAYPDSYTWLLGSTIIGTGKTITITYAMLSNNGASIGVSFNIDTDALAPYMV